MKKQRSNLELDRLLSGQSRAVPGPSRERMLEEVLRQSASKPVQAPGPFWRWLAPFAAVATAAMVWVLAPGAGGDEFAPRGGDRAPSFELACAPSCEPGAKLLLRLEGPGEFTHFASVARRWDGALIWYRSSAPIGQLSGDGWLPEAVVLGADHPPGDYRVYGIYSRGPLERQALRSAIEDPSSEGPAVVERVLSVKQVSP